VGTRNILLAVQFGQIKKTIFLETKNWNWFSKIYIYGKLLIIPFWSMSQKLWGVLVWRQLWIFYSKINFEILYSIPFSLCMEKNKIIGCRLFIKTFQPLGLAFVNSKIELLIIFYFESFSTSFYLLYFSYMLYNFKWFEKFQACNPLALKNECKEVLLFWILFHKKCELAKCSYLDLCRAKRMIYVAHTLKSGCWKFLNFFPHVLKSEYYTILWLHVTKNVYFSKIRCLYQKW